MQTLIVLLLINLFVVLAHESGFFISLDEWVSSKYRFHHLPKIFMCGCCQTFWLSVLYVLFSGNLSILTLVFCVANCHLTEITTPLVSLIKRILLKPIEIINRILDD